MGLAIAIDLQPPEYEGGLTTVRWGAHEKHQQIVSSEKAIGHQFSLASMPILLDDFLYLAYIAP
jgi:hypothetical protein